MEAVYYTPNMSSPYILFLSEDECINICMGMVLEVNYTVQAQTLVSSLSVNKRVGQRHKIVFSLSLFHHVPTEVHFGVSKFADNNHSSHRL